MNKERTTDHLASDIIAKRLASICNAKPVVCPPPRVRQQHSQLPERAARENVFRLASVYIRKNTSVRCVVNNVSVSGARISLKIEQRLPEIVVIKFDQNGARKRARVVWQKKGEAGIAFINDQTKIDSICPRGAPVRAAR